MNTAILLGILALVPAAQASLAFEKTNLQIESSLMDKELVAVFPFVNEGNKPVTILDLKSSCGCTVPELDKKEYAPGESGEIRAVFKFGGRQGVQRKRVTVVTNGSANPVHRLSFSTEIKDWAELEPKIMRWGANSDGAPREVRLRNLHPDIIRIREAPTAPSYFKLTRVRNSDEEIVYMVAPLDTSERITERISFTLEARDGGLTETRQIAFHCLVR